MGVAPKYLRDAIRLPTSATSLRPLRSMDRRELYVPRTRTIMAMSRAFAVIAPSFWNRLPPSARASLLSSNLSTSLSLLKTCLFSWGLIEPKAPLFACGCWGALYKYLNTIQYNLWNILGGFASTDDALEMRCRSSQIPEDKSKDCLGGIVKNQYTYKLDINCYYVLEIALLK